jgi:hypothetical protein
MKSWWKSKTVWVNVVAVLAGVVGYVAGQELIQDNTQFIAALVAVQGGLNVVLRFISGTPIE